MIIEVHRYFVIHIIV